MKVYKCDFCNKIKTCKHKDIEGKEYDVCAACWSDIAKKLKGKGRCVPVPVYPYVPYQPIYIRPYEWPPWGTSTGDPFPPNTITYCDTSSGSHSTNALDITLSH